MYVLGVSGFFHDSSAALLHNGKIVCAIAEERLTRIKQDGQFPQKAIQACLDEAGITLKEVSDIAIGWKPMLRWTKGFVPFVKNLPDSWSLLSTKAQSINLKIQGFPAEFRKRFGAEASHLKFHFLPHHLCHAASSYYFSGFEESAILTMDAAGEADATWMGIGQGGKIKQLHTIDAFNSLGMVYTTVTEFLGFEPDGDEWKVMGMAPYGRPTLIHEMDRLIELTPNGYKVNHRYFNFQKGSHPFFSEEFTRLFGPARVPDSEITKHHEDVAYGVQHLCEKVMLHLAGILSKRSGSKNLCVAGGVSLNCVGNGKILTQGVFDRFFCQPAASDDGTALGAAAWVTYNRKGVRYEPQKVKMINAYLGPTVPSSAVERAVLNSKMAFKKSSHVSKDVARLITEGKIIGWYQGKSEFGPRALGNRSIIADPRNADMKDKINAKVKFREGFRPFAPAILLERVSDYFDHSHPSPFMNLVYPIKKSKRAEIPAVTHVDGSGRLQTVTRDQNERYYDLIREFEALTSIPVILNTSFNVKGEPIVASPEDAIKCFHHSGLDCLVLGDYIFDSANA